MVEPGYNFQELNNVLVLRIVSRDVAKIVKSSEAVNTMPVTFNF